MPRQSEAAMFEKMISQLIEKKQHHERALAEINALFGRYGISLNGSHSSAKASNGTPAPAGGKGRRKRRKFGQTADGFILSLLQSRKSLMTSEINNAWKQSGRSFSANNTLGKLTKEKKIKRTKVKDGRGSAYSVA